MSHKHLHTPPCPSCVRIPAFLWCLDIQTHPFRPLPYAPRLQARSRRPRCPAGLPRIRGPYIHPPLSPVPLQPLSRLSSPRAWRSGNCRLSPRCTPLFHGLSGRAQHSFQHRTERKARCSVSLSRPPRLPSLLQAAAPHLQAPSGRQARYCNQKAPSDMRRLSANSTPVWIPAALPDLYIRS